MTLKLVSEKYRSFYLSCAVSWVIPIFSNSKGWQLKKLKRSCFLFTHGELIDEDDNTLGEFFLWLSLNESFSIYAYK